MDDALTAIKSYKSISILFSSMSVEDEEMELYSRIYIQDIHAKYMHSRAKEAGNSTKHKEKRLKQYEIMVKEQRTVRNWSWPSGQLQNEHDSDCDCPLVLTPVCNLPGSRDDYGLRSIYVRYQYQEIR